MSRDEEVVEMVAMTRAAAARVIQVYMFKTSTLSLALCTVFFCLLLLVMAKHGLTGLIKATKRRLLDELDHTRFASGEFELIASINSADSLKAAA